MIALFLLVVIALFGSVHWYLWRRLVRDVSAPGTTWRRVGTVLAVVMPILMITAQVAGNIGVPFGVERVLAWPGYYWFVIMLYLLLPLLAAEPVRPLARRVLARRAARTATPAAVGPGEPDGLRPGTPETVAGGGGDGLVGTASAETGAGESGTGQGDTTHRGGRTATALAEHEPGDAGVTDTDAPGNPTDTTGPRDPGRRLFVARTVALGAAAIAAGTTTYGTLAARHPVIKEVTVPLRGLPRSAHGYRIAVVSDIHLGPILGGSHCRRVVEAVNSTQPDLVTIVGDLVDAGVEDLRSAAAPLADLRSRDGSWYVTGNHEYYVGAEQWIDHVRELGITPLENAREELPWFDLAGVNDLAGEDSGQGPDLEAALADRDPRRTSVLMAHQPVFVHEAVEHNVDLQLSGHTHGGQMWPGTHLADLANPTLAGLERYGDTQLYVTRGAGSWGPPVRVGAEPDITVVRLASPEA
ncbi:metallophosphoesterase [Streptomyces sp. ST2-7A]|uniref:metallophosphoesterase n=1 Tax=Streptomyces sp. ST2-7A TaxID=2907214 RepID=UPI001F39F567|nr:metallophosphoesterase [Streptomyces sp. ST2-7A]MCE7078655.1 metallophosphoesterase [Streptomyces sp. ST2-7A]